MFILTYLPIYTQVFQAVSFLQVSLYVFFFSSMRAKPAKYLAALRPVWIAESLNWLGVYQVLRDFTDS
jgi:hypothetical protein